MKKVASSGLTALMGGAGLAVLVALLAPATAANAATVACTAATDLYAVSGTTTLGAQPVTVWGYNTTGGPATAPGGPTLCVNAGATITLTLHNTLAQDTALLFQGQPMAPDRSGAAPGATKVYTFTATKPGTYLYEAGLVPNGQHQVAMGLYGALIVRPAAAGQAYDAPATAYNDEAVLVLSEIDPALNNRAATLGGPATFDMRKYAPRYFLINGKAYPNTDPIPATAGSKVLLRYVNAGIQYHSMGVLGADQSVIALDGSPLNFPRRYVAETFGPGQSTDALVTAPTATTPGKLAIYDASALLHNSNTPGTGGMLTFVTTPGTGPGLDTTGPATSNVAYAGGNLSATISDATTGGANITGAEYFIDTVGPPGTGTAITASGPGSVNLTAPVSVPSGEHIIYVRGKDSAIPTNWGALSSVLVNGGDATGPSTKSPTLTPTPANGSTAVAVHATGDDTTTGASNITAAEYFIGAPGPNGTGTTMTVNTAAPIASLDAAIPAATVAATEGTRAVSIHAKDAAGNWGPPVTIDLVVDKTGPGTTGVTVAPSPNNGTLAFNSSTQSIRVSATLTDPVSSAVNSNISAAEAFIDTAGTTGTGIVVKATDGTYNTPTETGYTDIPLATVAQLTTGNHTIYVHAKDAAGNWGATATTTLVIDKLAPTFSSVSLAPNPTIGAANVTLTVNGAADTGGAGPAGGEYWINPPTTSAPAPGSGTQFSGLTANIPVGSLASGTYTVSVRIRDAANNWSTGTNGIRSATLTVVPDSILSNGFEAGARPWGWSSASTNTATRLNVTTAAALVGTRGLQAQGNNTNYVQYNFGTAANPASPTFNARFYFNPHNNTAVNQDIFVARTTAGTTVFRVRYRWNASSPQVQIQVGTGTGNTAWTAITNGASNRIEVVWQSGSTLQLFVGASNVANQSLTATTNSVGQLRLGSVTSNGNATLEYFDALSAKRTLTPYGP